VKVPGEDGVNVSLAVPLEVVADPICTEF